MSFALPLHPITRKPIQGELKPEEICPSCARCCRYVCIEIDAPKSVKSVSTILWFLYHRKVSVMEDMDGDWSVAFDADCENLQPSGLCGVYLDRPLICRDYDINGCEATTPVPVEKYKFSAAAEFVQWLSRRKPTLFKRCQDKNIIPPHLQAEERKAG